MALRAMGEVVIRQTEPRGAEAPLPALRTPHKPTAADTEIASVAFSFKVTGLPREEGLHLQSHKTKKNYVV